MQMRAIGMVAGLAGGIATALAMSLGRRAGILQKTLAEESEDWLDRKADTRRHLGRTGTTALEQANHLVAAAAFGRGYLMLRQRLPSVPTLPLGLAFGAGLYAVNIVGIAPLTGITQGEQNAPPQTVAQRLAMHLLFGVVTAGVADALRSR